MVWVGAAALLLAALAVRAHAISSTEVIIFCVLVPSVIVHEVSHGAVALALGDDTARRAGRLTLNPLRHVDVVGTIIVPALTIWAGMGFLGWAKPVPVDVRRLRSPRNHAVLVSLAGPATNVVLAALFGVLVHVLYAHDLVRTLETNPLGFRILVYAGILNLWVAIFNMVPLPPLDGSALVERLLPARWWPAYLRIRMRGLFVLVAVILLLSYVRVYPLDAVFSHVATWWYHQALTL